MRNIIRSSQIRFLVAAFGDLVSVVGDRVLVDVTVGAIGCVDVTDALDDLAAGSYCGLVGDHPQDVIDVLRCRVFGDGEDAGELIDALASAVERERGLEPGELGHAVLAEVGWEPAVASI